MASGTSDLTVVPNQGGDERSMVSDPSILGSLQRTSESAVSENIATGDDLSAGMESSILIASSEKLEIIDVEADPSPGMQPSLQTTSPMLDPAEDVQSSGTGSTSSPKMKDAQVAKRFFEKLKPGLLEKAVYASLEKENVREAQEKAQELFEAIEFVISKGKTLLKIPIQIKDLYHLRKFDFYYRLFIPALRHATKMKVKENPSIDRSTHSESMIVDNLSEYFEATDFIVFLIKKVQQEEDIKDPSLALQEAKTLVHKCIYGCIHRYEKETISTVIWLVVKDKDEKAKDLFKSLLEHMKPSDIKNRGRLYNYALRKAQELLKVRTFLSNPRLSKKYKDIVQSAGQLDGLIIGNPNHVKVQKFLVDLYLKDDHLKQERDWEFVKQNDYPYLIQCVWEYHKRKEPAIDVEQYNWTQPLQLNYVFTSSAAITVGGVTHIMKPLLEKWPTLVNAPYKGVAALHIAALVGNEEAIKYLLKQEKLDINVRTGRLLTMKAIEKYEDHGKLKCKGESLPHATAVADRDKLIEDHLRGQGVEGKSDVGPLSATKEFIQRISRKTWNKNRWRLPTFQTALHIATTYGHAEVVKLLCDSKTKHQQRVQCHEKDEENQTPVDIIHRRLDSDGKDLESTRIKRILLRKDDVKAGINRLYRNRQVLVDAVNTILVVAALVAGVTYAGWLQPPLGYAQYYDLAMPNPNPPDTYDSYLAIQGKMGVKAFALFNSLSFFFAIATVIVGADAAFPTQTYQYIGHVVETMGHLLQHAIRFLIISLVCVLGAFGSAAIVVLPPSLFFRKDLVLSIVIGSGVCGYTLWQSLSRHSITVQRLNASIAHIIKLTNVF